MKIKLTEGDKVIRKIGQLVGHLDKLFEQEPFCASSLKKRSVLMEISEKHRKLVDLQCGSGCIRA